MTVARRQFLQASLLGLTLSALPGELMGAPLLLSLSGFLLSIVIFDKEAKLGILNLKNGSVRYVQLKMDHPHAIVQVPLHLEKAIVVSKHGRELALVNLNEAKLEKKVSLPENNESYFGGHGCFSSDGKAFFVAEMSGLYGETAITVRDPDSLSELSRIKLSSNFPHDVALMPDGKSLAVTNYGTGLVLPSKQGSIDIVEISTGKILRRGVLRSLESGTNHLVVSPSGYVAAAGTYQTMHSPDETQRRLILHGKDRDFDPSAEPASILLARPGAEFTKLKDEKVFGKMIYGQSLAICEATETLAVTYHTGQIITFWSLEKAQMKSFLDLGQGGRGIFVTPDQKYFVGHLYDGTLVAFDSKTLARVDVGYRKGFRNSNATFVSAHLYHFAKIA